MLSTSIVIFREVFEIVLIVSIILAATRDMLGRNKWITLGFSAGIIGSGLVAFFIEAISNFSEGMGQEIFNALILFTASVFIGWTLLWMKAHSRDMKSNFTELGENISDGKLPFYSLSIVIALAVLREGSEIVLFTYGMFASGQTTGSYISGTILGILSGLAVGITLYRGLLKISPRYFFSVTSCLLIFLVAGMVSQGAGFLVSAGYFENFSQEVWNTSWLINDRSAVGQCLKTLVGYTARPSLIQVLVYTMTIGILFLSISKNILKVFVPVFIILMSFGSSPAYATRKVYAPYVDLGELEIEWRGSYDVDHNEAKDGKQKQKGAIGYGITEKWFSEIYAELEKSGASGADFEFTAIEWENRFQVFERGEHWLDLGVYTAYKISLEDNGADKAEVQLLLAKDYGKTSNLLNVKLEKQIGNNANKGTALALAWSARYRYTSEFEPGIELYNDFGSLNESKAYRDQKHLLGPAVYGKFSNGVKYNVGYLFGISDAAPDSEFKWILEYEIRF